MRIAHRLSHLGIISLGLFFSVQVTGCSVMGLLIGAASDGGRPPFQTIRPYEALLISPGAYVTFQLKDGSSLTGRYLGIGRVPEPEYRRDYGAWRDSLSGSEPFPALGDTVSIARVSGGILVAALQGFAYRRVLVGLPGGGAGGVGFDNVVSMSDASGQTIDRDHLTALDAAGELPSATALRVLASRDTALVAMDRVRAVAIATQRHGARNGFLIGLAVDAVIVVVASSQEARPSSPDCGPPPSGPYFSAYITPLEVAYDVRAGRPLASGRAAHPTAGAIRP